MGYFSTFDFFQSSKNGKTAQFNSHLKMSGQPSLLTSDPGEYIVKNAGLEEAQAEIKITGRHVNNLRYAYDTTLMAESKEEPKSLLLKVREESEKFGLKLNIQKMKIMASGPITSWQIDGKQWKQ